MSILIFFFFFLFVLHITNFFAVYSTGKRNKVLIHNKDKKYSNSEKCLWKLKAIFYSEEIE